MPLLDAKLYPDCIRSSKTLGGKFQLWYEGDISLLKRPLVAVVGTRNVSIEGERNTKRLAAMLANSGVVVLSGMARGVDRIAHEAALETSGTTIAVMGTSIGECYPKEHATLKQRIIERGLVISQFPAGAPISRSNFPRRNELMAALCPITFIVEASADSGTKHQVKAALRCNHKIGFLRWMVERQYSWVMEALKQGNGFNISTARDVTRLLELVGFIEPPNAEAHSSPVERIKTNSEAQPEFAFEISTNAFPSAKNKRRRLVGSKRKKQGSHTELPPLLQGFEDVQGGD